jgi:fatty-acyl-CoA synthase
MAKRKTPKKAPTKKTKAKAAKKPSKPAPKKTAAKKKAAPKAPARTAARKAPMRATTRNRRRIARATTRPAHPVKTRLARNPYDTALDRNAANYQPLTPITFLERAAKVFPERVAILHGTRGWTYADFYARARKLASALARHGIRRGDTVAAMMTNTPGMLELHYGVPMTGGVLNTLNTRLDAATLAFMLDHGEAKVLITDREFAPVVKQMLSLAKVKPLVIDYDDREFPQTGEMLGSTEYEQFIAEGDPEFAWVMPRDEWDAISLNYTSGTTGNPKGVVFHHRGAALMGYGNVIAAKMPMHPVYLWTVPMFHCNGWCFPWSLSVVAGTHVCLRWVRAKAMYDALADHGVTHLCGAPIVMSTLLNAPENERHALPHVVQFITAAAPPPEAVLAQMAEAGFNVTHVYGLTETYGPAVVNEWKDSWQTLEPGARAAKKARQGVRYHALDALTVMDPETMEHTPADGTTLGEVMFRGNIVMKGYLKNPSATREAFAGGWFHSGDLGVMHPDGYIQLKDRSKDIIISGGENISSLEVEDVLMKHPAVMFAAVVARPDEKWGETPCAFIEKKAGHDAVTSTELIAYCRERMAHYKAPRHVIFTELPKTSTGKVQKFKLREMAKEVG